jgi:hypothetical protein
MLKFVIFEIEERSVSNKTELPLFFEKTMNIAEKIVRNFDVNILNMENICGI